MKEKYTMIALLMIMTLALSTTVIYVGYDQDDDYTTIQEGIDAASYQDTVSVGDGWYYGEIDLHKNILLISEGGWENCTITTGYDARGITVNGITNSTEINGFRFWQCRPNQNELHNWVGGAIFVWIAQTVTIENCSFEENRALYGGGAIYHEEGNTNLNIIGNRFIGNYIESTGGLNSPAHAIGIFADIPCGSPAITNISYNLFDNNRNDLNEQSVVRIVDTNSNNDFELYNNTFNNCYQGIYLQMIQGNSAIKNCIFSDIDDYAVYCDYAIPDIKYCAFHFVGNTSNEDLGEGCLLNTAPVYCELENYKYWLMEGSSCIDRGDPDTDADGTQKDIGSYPTTTDMKLNRGERWNWISCPRMPDNSSTLAGDVFDNLIPLDDLSIIHKLDIFHFIDESWYPYETDLQSWKCYKFYPDYGGYVHLPMYGDRLDPLHVISLVAGQDNWIGYYMPFSNDIDQAFYDTSWNNRWDDILSIKAEKWYYLDMSSPRDPKPSMEIHPLHYGKGYVVKVKESFDLVWKQYPAGGRNRYEDEPEPEFFDYQDLPDYEVIDIMDIDENIQEIGVFENGICVGAVVVDEPAEQILVYSDQMNREGFELTFEVYEGRGKSNRIDNYFVFDEKSGRYIIGTITGGNQEYSTVILGETLEPGEQEIDKIILHQNYPNPFKPHTVISYNLPLDSEVKLEIYNMKGQLVKTLYNGNQVKGEYSITWQGDDENSNPVSSGIYFYRLESGNEVVNRKMILMR